MSNEDLIKEAEEFVKDMKWSNSGYIGITNLIKIDVTEAIVDFVAQVADKRVKENELLWLFVDAFSQKFDENGLAEFREIQLLRASSMVVGNELMSKPQHELRVKEKIGELVLNDKELYEIWAASDFDSNDGFGALEYYRDLIKERIK